MNRGKGTARTFGFQLPRLHAVAFGAGYNDAAAGFRWLTAKPWVDPKQVFVMGMSRGGEAAIHMAVEFNRRRLMTTDLLFAAYRDHSRRLQFPGARREHDRRADLLHAG